MSAQSKISLEDVLARLKASDKQQLELVDVLEWVEQIVDAAQNNNQSNAGLMAEELQEIYGHIAETREEISQLPAYNQDRVPEAGKELDEIVKATEQATHQIMSQAEIILAADTSDFATYQEEVTGAVMQIFEACSFQDITGQRIAKVVKTLEYVESRISALTSTIGLPKVDNGDSETDEERRERELILNGPTLEGQGIDQDGIDKLLTDPEGEASQDDIDALFD